MVRSIAQAYFLTQQDRSHATRQTQTGESVLKDFVALQRRRGTVRDLNARRLAVVNAVATQRRVRLVANQHARLRVAEDLVLFENS